MSIPFVQPVGNFVRETGRIGLFCREIVHAATRRPFFGGELTTSMRRIAFQCLLPVVAVVGPTGMVMALQSLKIFDSFGLQRLLSSLLAEAMFRELSPTLTAIMIAAQAGSSIAGELGTMRVQEEIDALGVMGINPFQFLIIPRMLALALMCPLINAMACFSGMAGGFLVAVFLKGLNAGVFWANMLNFLTLSHIWSGVLKASIFGIVVGIIACYKGYNVTGGALGVGRAANETVVHSILLIVVLNYFLTSFLLVALG
ncbi:MAG: ABC transporter permease [Candidatus Sericytochromatia bacterium]|nr:ABC transporter permease [Candidatus Sericytochromatia bacterium]